MAAHASLVDWLCWGLTTRQPLWVILCRLPEKGRKVVEEIKERDREERNWNESEETEEIKYSPSTLTCYKDSRPCPTVSQYHGPLLSAYTLQNFWQYANVQIIYRK